MLHGHIVRRNGRNHILSTFRSKNVPSLRFHSRRPSFLEETRVTLKERGTTPPTHKGGTDTSAPYQKNGQDIDTLNYKYLFQTNRTWENIAGVGVAVFVVILGLCSLETNPWEAYEVAVKMNPIETKACISGVVYSIGDLIAQNYEGRDISEWDRGRIFRSGLCGLLAHGPLSHLYYLGLDTAFAQQSLIDTNSWISPLIKVGIDQTVWSIFWNSTYYILLGILKAESPKTIMLSVQQSWWDLLKAGWRLWPIVHVCTYGIIPVQHRLLFVDAVELVWVCILSTYGQQQREARKLLSDSSSWVSSSSPGAAADGGDFSGDVIGGITEESRIVLETCAGEKIVKPAQEVFSSDS